MSSQPSRVTDRPPREGLSDRVGLLAAILLFVILTLPFAGRAHHIDDPLYLELASRVLSHPLDPLSGASFWHERPTTLFFDLYSPPLVGYLLALPVAIAGGSEVAIHLLMILLGAALLWAAASAGAALGVDARWTLLLATSPLLSLMAVTAMTDLPFVLLCLLTWNAAVRGQGAASGALAGLSSFAKFAGLLNLPILGVALRGRRRGVRTVAIGLGLAVFGIYCAWNLVQHGTLHVLASSRYLDLGVDRLGRSLFCFVSSLGLVGLPAALGLLRWTRGLTLAAAAPGLAAGGVFLVQTGSWIDALIAGAAIAAGAALLWTAGAASLRHRDVGPVALLGFWLYAVNAVVFVYFGSARYAFPLLVPLIWLLVRGRQVVTRPSALRWGGSLAASAALALALLASDGGYADSWRRLAQRLPRSDRGFSVGHWGFQWYAARSGYVPLAPRELLRPGDRVAEAVGVHAQPIPPAAAAVLSKRATTSVGSPGLRVMDQEARAGLYSDAWGLLPFGFRSGAREQLVISETASWLIPLLSQPPAGPVAVELGSELGRHVRLDGWSEPESYAFEDRRRSFVWGLGRESALRLPLPSGVERLSLLAATSEEAVGPLRIHLGPEATATLELRAGWHVYEVPVIGRNEGGLTTILVRPAEHRRPGPFARERRELAVAVSRIGFGDGGASGNRGFWPVRSRSGSPGLVVTQTALVLPQTETGQLEGHLQILAGTARIERDDAVVWSGGPAGSVDCGSHLGCSFVLPAAPGAGPARLWAEQAVLLGLEPHPD